MMNVIRKWNFATILSRDFDNFLLFDGKGTRALCRSRKLNPHMLEGKVVLGNLHPFDFWRPSAQSLVRKNPWLLFLLASSPCTRPLCCLVGTESKSVAKTGNVARALCRILHHRRGYIGDLIKPLSTAFAVLVLFDVFVSQRQVTLSFNMQFVYVKLTSLGALPTITWYIQ